MSSSGSTRRLALLFAFSSAALAAAQPVSAQTPPPEEDRPPIQIGPVGLRPTLAFRNIGMDNNVFNEHEKPKKDFTFSFVPTLEATVQPGRLLVSVTSLNEYVYYRKYTSERSSNNGFSARADVDLTMLRPFVTYSSTHTSERPSTEIDLRARRSVLTYSAGTSLRLGEITSVRFSARNVSQTFREGQAFRGQDLATELNSETRAYETALMFALTPLTSVGVNVSKERDRFERSGLRDSDTLRVTPTVVFSPLGVMRGTASVGYRRFTSRDPQVEDFTGLVAAGTVGTSIGERVRIDTTFARDVRYSYETRTPTYVLNSGRATVTTQLFGGLDVRVTGGRDAMSYRPLAGEEDPGDDVYHSYGGGIAYRFPNNMQVGVDAEFFERASGLAADRQYTNNRIVGTLTWGARR